MPGSLAQVFSTVTGPARPLTGPAIPLINQPAETLSSFLATINQIRVKKALMSWYKSIPELTAIVDKVARDMVYKWHFEPVNPTDSGRNKVFQVNKFSQMVFLRRLLFSQAIDMLITGEAFGWMGKVTEEKLKKEIEKALGYQSLLETKEKSFISRRLFNEYKEFSGFADLDKVDEDVLRPRKYRYVASSTVEIIYDQLDIKGYKQVVGVNHNIFTPKDIIHYTLQDVDGKVNGFTPVLASIVQLELLRQMWQNQLSLHKNGGYPDKIFSFENVRVGDAAYKRIEEQLIRYKKAETKHGNMLFTGKLNVHELQQLSEMQFKDLGLYITGLLAMQWQVPRSSIPYIIGGTNTKDDTGGNSEKGYWRNIEFAQQIFADIMNTQLWIPHFGVKIVFDHTFIQQDVQIQTARQLRLNNLITENQLLGKQQERLSDQTLRRELGRSVSELEKQKEEDIPKIPSTLDQQLPADETEGSDDKRNIAAAKRLEQDQVIARRGVQPSGVSKEWDAHTEVEYKSMFGKEENLIRDVDTFVRLFHEDMAYNSGKPPRMFFRKNKNFVTLKFMSSDFVYRLVIPSPEFNELLKMKLYGASFYQL